MNAFSKDYTPVIEPKEIKSTSKRVKKVDPHVNSHIYLGKKETSQERADRRKKLTCGNSVVGA
jgi:ribosomal protein L17